MKFDNKIFKYKWVIALIILSIIGGAWFWNSRSGSNARQTAQYQTGQAEKGTLIVSITGSGQVSTSNTTAVNTDIGGTVEEVYVKSGDKVEAGTPLAKIKLDADAQQKQLAAYATYLNAVNSSTQAQINKATAQNTLESARQAVLEAAQAVTEMENRVAASQPNPTTKQAYTENEIQVIKSKLTQARSNFSIAEQKYKSTDTSIAASNATLASNKLDYQTMTNTITAPTSGSLSNFTLQTGDTIDLDTSSSASNSSNNNSTTTQKVATINTENKPSITVDLSEIDITKVAIGNKVTMTFDALGDKTFTGVVTDIDTTGAVSSGVVTYPITITSDTDINQLYANMTVTANIITHTKPNVLLVPSSAVQKSNDISTVRVLRNGHPEMVTVEVGESSDTQVEVVSGISEGVEVVTSTTIQSGATQSGTSPFSGNRGFGGTGGLGTGGGQRVIINR